MNRSASTHAGGGSGSSDPDSTSTSLLRQVKDQDPGAWERLGELYGPMVYAWCRQAGLGEADISDVVQNVFSSVFKSVARFQRDGPNGSFRGWLWKITRNEVLMLFRRQAKEPRAAGGTDAQEAIQQVPEVFASERLPTTTGSRALLVRRAVDMLQDAFEPHTWQAFWRTTVDGQPAPEVAEELGMTPVAVRQAKYRVLKRLRDFLADD